MEAVGLVASVITLIGAASVTGSALTRIWGLRGVPLYVVTALNEVNDFKAILSSLQVALDINQLDLSVAAQAELNRLLFRAQERLRAFNSYLQNKVLQEGGIPANENSLRLRKRAKFREAIGQAQCQIDALQQELISIKLSLVLVLAVTKMHAGQKLPTVIQKVSLIQPGTEPTVSSDFETDSGIVSAVEQAVVMSPMQTARFGTVGTLQSRHALQECTTYIKIETKALSQNCRGRCPCQCHISLHGSTPIWLRGLIGATFFNLINVPLLNRRSCNFGHCGQKEHSIGAVRFQYFFPSWLLHLGIAFAASWSSLDGIGGTWTLRIPRTFTGFSTYIELDRIMRDGTVTEFCDTMRNHGVKSHDLILMRRVASLVDFALISGREDICTMLLHTGADLNTQDGDGLSIAELIWLRCLISPQLQGIQTLPELQQARDSLKISVGTDLVFKNDLVGLKRHIALYPEAVLLQDCYGLTPLHWAVIQGCVEAEDLLLDAGADVNAICKRGRTAMHWAVIINPALKHKNVPKIVSLLLKAGALVTHRDRQGSTALHIAAQQCPPVVLEDIFRHGAQVEARDWIGCTAIFDAVDSNNHAALQWFIDHKVCLHRFNLSGDSLLHYAAWFGDIKTMSILQAVQISGLPMDPSAIERYWECFDQREERFQGKEAPREIEKAAFSALLNSVVSPTPNSPPLVSRIMPGAFPLELGMYERAPAADGDETYEEDR